MFSARLRHARPLKAKAGMMSRNGVPEWCPGRTAIRHHRQGGLIATRVRVRLAIFCQSFVGISPRAMLIGRQSGGGRRYCPQAAKASVKTRVPVCPFCTAKMARSPLL